MGETEDLSRAPERGSGSLQSESTPAEEVRRELLGGLLYVHSRLNANSSEAIEAATFISALVDLLRAKGIFTLEELEARRQEAGRRVAQQFGERGIGVTINPDETDKYAFPATVEIDCASRVSLCGAACCRLPFSLSKQDVREGIVRWDVSNPYMNLQRDGYCCHIERRGLGCTIHARRPIPCRAFDCRRDRRIWLDFDKRIPQPSLSRPDWPHCLNDSEAAGGGAAARPALPEFPTEGGESE
jgi:hypothetical protein